MANAVWAQGVLVPGCEVTLDVITGFRVPTQVGCSHYAVVIRLYVINKLHEFRL